jgi:hypothetical protein
MRMAAQFTFLKYDSQFCFVNAFSITKIALTKKIEVIESVSF